MNGHGIVWLPPEMTPCWCGHQPHCTFEIDTARSVVGYRFTIGCYRHPDEPIAVDAPTHIEATTKWVGAVKAHGS